MFSINKSILSILIVGFSFTVQATEGLSEGREYKLVQHNLEKEQEGLCPNFTVADLSESRPTITIANQYTFETQNSNFNVASEFYSSCRFIEHNRINKNDDETHLVRINQEVCKGKIVSSTSSTVVIRQNQIELRHEIKGAEPITCLWNK